MTEALPQPHTRVAFHGQAVTFGTVKGPAHPSPACTVSNVTAHEQEKSRCTNRHSIAIITIIWSLVANTDFLLIYLPTCLLGTYMSSKVLTCGSVESNMSKM